MWTRTILDLENPSVPRRAIVGCIDRRAAATGVRKERMTIAVRFGAERITIVGTVLDTECSSRASTLSPRIQRRTCAQGARGDRRTAIGSIVNN